MYNMKTIKRFSFWAAESSDSFSSETVNGKPVKVSRTKVNLENTNGRLLGTRTYRKKIFSREDVPQGILQEAKSSGVIQKVGDSWRIISMKKKKFWDAHYKSKENAEAALRAYQARKHGN